MYKTNKMLQEREFFWTCTLKQLWRCGLILLYNDNYKVLQLIHTSGITNFKDVKFSYMMS